MAKNATGDNILLIQKKSRHWICTFDIDLDIWE